MSSSYRRTWNLLFYETEFSKNLIVRKALSSKGFSHFRYPLMQVNTSLCALLSPCLPLYLSWFIPLSYGGDKNGRFARSNAHRRAMTMSTEKKNAAASRVERRHVATGGGKTTIALEPEFWSAADTQARARGMDWRQWTAAQLMAKPTDYGRAGWLRVSILRGATDGKKS